VVVVVDKSFHRNWIANHFVPRLERVFDGAPVDIRLCAPFVKPKAAAA
jgi:hypothetical protein